jgi:hypothetical protein
MKKTVTLIGLLIAFVTIKSIAQTGATLPSINAPIIKLSPSEDLNDTTQQNTPTPASSPPVFDAQHSISDGLGLKPMEGKDYAPVRAFDASRLQSVSGYDQYKTDQRFDPSISDKANRANYEERESEMRSEKLNPIGLLLSIGALVVIIIVWVSTQSRKKIKKNITDGTKLFFIVKGGTRELERHYKVLSDNGKFEVLLFNSLYALQLFHHQYPSRYSAAEDEFFMYLLEQARKYRIDLSEELLKHFIDYRFEFFADEMDNMRQSIQNEGEGRYIPTFFYTCFYVTPLAHEIEPSFDLFEIMKFYPNFVSMVQWIEKEVNSIGELSNPLINPPAQTKPKVEANNDPLLPYIVVVSAILIVVLIIVMATTDTQNKGSNNAASTYIDSSTRNQDDISNNTKVAHDVFSSADSAAKAAADTTTTIVAKVDNLISKEGYSDDNYQVFPSAGFKIKCPCNLRVDSSFIQMHGEKAKIIGAYVCEENENDPEYIIFNNINILDISTIYSRVAYEMYGYLESNYLEKQANYLSASGIAYEYVTYRGVKALQYSVIQSELSTRIIIFLKNKKSYSLQVSSRHNLISKFDTLKNSFEIL